MARQGFKYESDTPYIYQEDIGNDSAALGIDPASGGVYKIKVQSTAGADVSGTYQVQIDPAANGDIDLNPNGSGSVNVSTAVNLPHADNGSSQGYITFNDIKWAHNYGDGNTFVGENAGNNTLTAASSLGNTALGALSGQSLTTGSLNTFAGNRAGQNCTSGSHNCAFGQDALGSATSSNSTALGFNALAAYAPGSSDTGQVAVGFDCLQSVITGTECTFIGAEAGQNLTSANQCTVLGRQACDVSTSIGNGNICIGYRAARNSTLGANNIIIGNSSGTNYTASQANNILINNIGGNSDANQIRIGTQGSGPGQQNKCSISGIAGTTPSNTTTSAVLIDSGGSLGTTGATVINMSTDTTNCNLNIGTGAAVKGVNLGSTTTTSATVILSGSAGTSMISTGSIVMNSGLTVDSSGRTTNTAQPAFHAYLSAPTANNVTGDGTNYVIIFDSEKFDVGGNFDTATGIFTAPKTGKYLFCINFMTTNSVGAQTTGQLFLVTTSDTYEAPYDSPTATRNAGDFYGKQLSILAQMTAGDTAYVQLNLAGSTKTVGIFGSATGTYTWFTGLLQT